MCSARWRSTASGYGNRSAPAGRGGCRAHAHEATFFSWEPHALEGPAHRWDTDPEALGVRHPGAEFLQGDLWHGMDGLPDQRLGGGIEPALLASCVRFWCDVSRAPVAA